MTDIERKIMEFLVTGKTYSDEAIMKNLGINQEELQKAFDSLLKDGYIETYEDYLKRMGGEEEQHSCGVDGCCGGGCSGCGTPIIDKKNVKVITAKALIEFEL
ncbi:MULTISPECIES: hypothetical protein [Fusobacterium]|uniref:hypothetical protein n=1 Tax=Fusobacterium TaxID=848 RepID=UPI001476F5CB|nr:MULTISPECIES: hypothetical protein [Fusobacterium]NME35930.1 hypothetical protein [Fusobacterium sp. FSA-380-WT-3A]